MEAVHHPLLARYSAMLDAVPAHIALLDNDGEIVAVNEAWRRFASANVPSGTDFYIGRNYVTVCERATGECMEEAGEVAIGLRRVLAGELREFALEYPCHSPTQQRWYRMMVTPLHADRRDGVVVMHVDVTTRKQDEVELRNAERLARESEQRLGFALEAAEVGDWSLDLLTNEAHRSLRHDQCFGYAELLPHWGYDTFLAHVHPNDRESVNAGFQAAMAGLGDYNHDFRTTWPDGTEHWLWTRGRFYFDAWGKPCRVAGIVTDITKRRESERAMQRAMERLTEAQRIGKIGDWEWSITAGRITWSPEVFRIFGRDPALGPPADVDEMSSNYDEQSRINQADAIGAITRTGAPQDYELSLTRPDGQRAHIRALALARRGEDGGVVELYGTVQDITEQKRAEAEAQQLAAIVASSDDAIIGKDLDGIVTSWNHGAERIFGFTTAEMVHSSIRAIIPPDREGEMGLILSEVREGRSLEHFETVRMTKDGRCIDVSVTASPIRDAKNRVIGVSKVSRDISSRKRLEQQFLRAQRMESIGTLAGGIAHDLNNALGPIILSLDLLKMSFTDDESRELLEVIEVSARHGADMVRQVLSFARGVDGQRVEVQVGQLVTDVVRITRDTFLKNIQVQMTVPPDLWRVVGDPTQLHQVLLNLCVNARDAMPDGGTLAMTATNVTLDAHYAGIDLDATPGTYVAVQVEDSGTGISADHVERIFDPFFTTKDVGKGTGLGLSTSQAIVKSHGGFIRVYSEPGAGTKFKVYLPARLAADGDVAPAAAVLPRGHGECVLVVDDEPSFREITQRTLEAFGYRAIVACDGAEAVAIYAQRAQDIAVVLTDMTMPIMDGPSTIRVLRKLNPAVRIIGASGLSTNGQAGQSTAHGVRHFLCKPYTADALLSVLRDALTEDR